MLVLRRLLLRVRPHAKIQMRLQRYGRLVVALRLSL
jgi:hypothetical protein